jgi:hypothetical protein
MRAFGSALLDMARLKNYEARIRGRLGIIGRRQMDERHVGIVFDENGVVKKIIPAKPIEHEQPETTLSQAGATERDMSVIKHLGPSRR